MPTYLPILRSGLLGLLLFPGLVQAFCGFYVAGAGASLYNEASQVVLVRMGGRTTITMSNDFKGNVRDFALVIPVPVVLQEKDIRIADPGLFGRLDAYSAPRLVEYWDENPCEMVYYEEDSFGGADMAIDDESVNPAGARAKALGVTIEARYQVGEYDILILSGKESKGLATWLKENGYYLPPNAKEVLEPYIKNDIKFFVVKVNLEKLEAQAFNSLRPIQISYEHPRFMLPIRLGMANSRGYQDLIIYALTPKGRVETANYRTVEIPSNLNIPLRIKEHFGPFYKAVFERAWTQQRRSVALLEYAWDLSSSNFSFCDPCSSDPPAYADLKEAGVFWLEAAPADNEWGQQADYKGEVHFTRLHLRYGRSEFPEDLMFVETSNRESFQGRYILHHPATGDLSCTEGKEYLESLKARKKEEEVNLYKLTGWANNRIPGTHDDTPGTREEEDKNSFPWISHDTGNGGGNRWPIVAVSLLLTALLLLMPRLLGRLERNVSHR
ncbi:MAG: DUF2330 domain-containing protein [Bacteroidetes bacterium]|nr:DUF2330 domain-containing protein [Bacteroidota bacterium]